jgi:hypothetical protein
VTAAGQSATTTTTYNSKNEMDMTALTVLQQLAPSVHPLDQARALQECTALADKYKARKAYHEQMVTAEVDIFDCAPPVA